MKDKGQTCYELWAAKLPKPIGSWGSLSENAQTAWAALEEHLNPWISCDERMPTEADAVNGLIEYTFEGKGDAPGWIAWGMLIKGKSTSWRRIVRPQKADPFETWLSEWCKNTHNAALSVTEVDIMQCAFEAGRQHERSIKP